MLTHDPRKNAATARCDRCNRTTATIEAASHVLASDAFTALGWLECARKGKGRARWDWWCPGCVPKTSETFGGLSTGHFASADGSTVKR